MRKKQPFWKILTLYQMTPEQWESLCDGCGLCCLYKYEDANTHKIFYTNVACRFMDLETCLCTVYPERTVKMPSCVVLNPMRAKQLKWLPDTCAYRLIAEGKNLPAWHPLVSGDAQSVHQAGISVKNKVISEEEIDMRDLENYVIGQMKTHSRKSTR